MWTKEEYLSAVESNDNIKQELIKTINEDYIDKYLTFLPLVSAGGLFIEDVVDEIKRQMEKLKSKTGHYYSLIVDDYPAKLMLRHSRGMESRDKLAYIYLEFQRLAAEFQCHSLTPAQLNRTGYKENKERQPGEYQGLDNISEAFGIAMNSDNVLILNRSDLDAKNNKIYIVVDKTKENEHKRTIMLNTDYSRVITHDPTLGALIMGKNAFSVQVLSPNNLTKQ
jgi:replicative DNA helicase